MEIIVGQKYKTKQNKIVTITKKSSAITGWPNYFSKL